MRHLILATLLLVPGAVFGQTGGGTAIPDGLDCSNLTSDQENYREYCKDVQTTGHASPEKIVEVYRAKLTSSAQVIALKEKGWTALENGDYDAAQEFFSEALSLNEGNEYRTSRDYHRTHLREAIRTAEYLAESADHAYGYWQGQGYADQLASAAEKADEAKESKRPTEAEAESAPIEAPWHNIKYACYGEDNGRLYEGLEILQTVENSGPNWLDVKVTLRFNDMHPRYHRHVFVDKFVSFEKLRREDWYALVNVRNGMEWTSEYTVRIPRQWSVESSDASYTATWDDALRRYRFTQGGQPLEEAPELETFAVHVECYQHDPEPRGQDRYSDSFDGVPHFERF